MSTCGACKYQRRRCYSDICMFAPYFPAENIQRFACVHHVFGGGNVGSMLNITKPKLRGWVVKTLAYQAEARVRDPVHGCVGLIRELEENHRKVKEDLAKAQMELARYMGPEFVRKLSPNYGGESSLKGKFVAHLQPTTMELDFAPSIAIDVDDLDKWDPFPPWETSFQNVGPSSSHAHGEGGNRKDSTLVQAG
ncbi:hypothetical protein JHK84_047806 [Glycine max]|nr:hypothetical protein JHK86_047786 [Glycine max]KAG4943756.1 hypothetical protein JHK85_048402 [Glycine max]KAG5102837.1 hypothetical protein JHK84_047806 [Glycine max]